MLSRFSSLGGMRPVMFSVRLTYHGRLTGELASPRALTSALPQMTPSAPQETICFACSGRDTPKPTQICGRGAVASATPQQRQPQGQRMQRVCLRQVRDRAAAAALPNPSSKPPPV